LVWLHGEIKTPPLAKEARLQAGYLLRLLQQGASLGLPWSRPMPSVAPRCHELRVSDPSSAWRIIYRVDPDAIVILEVFRKQGTKTPEYIKEVCRTRLRAYDSC
jgi:phage-related protein